MHHWTVRGNKRKPENPCTTDCGLCAAETFEKENERHTHAHTISIDRCARSLRTTHRLASNRQHTAIRRRRRRRSRYHRTPLTQFKWNSIFHCAFIFDSAQHRTPNVPNISQSSHRRFVHRSRELPMRLWETIRDICMRIAVRFDRLFLVRGPLLAVRLRWRAPHATVARCARLGQFSSAQTRPEIHGAKRKLCPIENDTFSMLNTLRPARRCKHSIRELLHIVSEWS